MHHRTFTVKCEASLNCQCLYIWITLRNLLYVFITCLRSQFGSKCESVNRYNRKVIKLLHVQWCATHFDESNDVQHNNYEWTRGFLVPKTKDMLIVSGLWLTVQSNFIPCTHTHMRPALYIDFDSFQTPVLLCTFVKWNCFIRMEIALENNHLDISASFKMTLCMINIGIK